MDRPQRVKRVVHIGCPAMLLDSGGPLPLRTLGIPLAGQILRYLQRPTPGHIQALFSAMNEDIINEKYPELFSAWLEAEKLPNFNKAWRLLLRSVFNVFGPRSGVPIEETELRGISHPMQFIWGEHDPFGSVDLGKRAADMLPNAHFHTIDGGHLPWLDQPENAAKTI